MMQTSKRCLKKNTIWNIRELMKLWKFTEEQIGMIFYTNVDKTKTHVVSCEDFQKIPPEDIGEWVEISTHDVLD